MCVCVCVHMCIVAPAPPPPHLALSEGGVVHGLQAGPLHAQPLHLGYGGGGGGES